MNRKKVSFFMALLIVLVAVSPVLASTHVSKPDATLAQEEGMVVIAPGETIQVGLAASLSGDVLPEAGQDIANAAQLAIDTFNEAGGLVVEGADEGFQVELLVEDDQCDPAQGTSVANLLVTEPRLVAVVGHMCSGATIAASEVYQEARIPMVSASATAKEVVTRDLDVVNRTVFSDLAQATVDSRYIYTELGVTKVAVLHDNSDYGKGLATLFSDAFVNEMGGELVGEMQGIDPAEENYRPVLTVLSGEEPELVFFGGYANEAAKLTSQMKELGMESLFFSDDGAYVQSYLDLTGEDSEGAYASSVLKGGDEEANAEFATLYEETFGIKPEDLGPYHAQSYDATNIILEALKQVAVLDDDGNLVIDREELIKAVRATKDYDGLSGMITCNENGDCATGLIQVYKVEDGEWVEVEVPDELQFSAPAAE